MSLHKVGQLAAAAIFGLIGPCGLASSTDAATPWRTFEWTNGQLTLREGRSIPASLRPILVALNERRFDDALGRLHDIDGEPQLKGELAIAIAGHLRNDQPEKALAVARDVLSKQVRSANAEVGARTLLHEVVVYETLHAIKLPWAPRSPGHSWVPSPQLIPARDLARAGKLEDARQLLAATRQAPASVELLMAWQMAAFFENDDPPVYQQLMKDLDAAIASAFERGDDNAKRSVTMLKPLLAAAKSDETAFLNVPRESLLYSRAMLEPMRAYYWWYRQMGAERPMAKQGFDEVISSVRKPFPEAPIVKVYAGQRVAWGDELELAHAPEGAPPWAVHQRELRARIDHIVRWWFRVRQQPDGQLGGGWEDDCEALRRFTQSALICDDAVVKAGINRLADGIWDRSGKVIRGFDADMKDVEHASEMAADTSVLLALDYGDPHHFERFLQSCKTTDERHFGRNESGRRQYRGMVLNADGVDPNPNTAFDVLYCGRAMRPIAMVAWYSRNPRAVALLHDWAETWSAAALRAADGKPAGVFPAAIQFGSERLAGRSTWWDPGLGGLYRWNAQDIDMVLAKVLEAWRLTGDDRLLDGVKAQLDLLQRAVIQRSPESTDVGSADWVAHQIRNHLWMAAWYRSYTGRADYDILAPGVSYWRFQMSRDFPALQDVHVGELNAMRFNLPMLTTEVRGTDRINLAPFSLTGAMTGSHVPITQTPTYAVTWTNVSRDFAALVGEHDSESITAWAYSCRKTDERPGVRFWQLAPGRYRLSVFADANFDGEPDGPADQTYDFKCVERLTRQDFVLPSQRLCLLHVEQLSKSSPRPDRLPDLAITSRDLTFPETAQVGKACRGQVVIHNIGSAEAKQVRVIATMTGPDQSELTLQSAIDVLDWPSDLVAVRKTIDLGWTPTKPGRHTVHVRLTTAGNDPEICSFNNEVKIAVEVKPMESE